MTGVLISTPCGILARRFPAVTWLFAISDCWHCLTDYRQAGYCYHTILNVHDLYGNVTVSSSLGSTVSLTTRPIPKNNLLDEHLALV